MTTSLELHIRAFHEGRHEGTENVDKMMLGTAEVTRDFSVRVVSKT